MQLDRLENQVVIDGNMDEFLGQVRRSITAQRKAMDRALNAFSSTAPSNCICARDNAFLKRRGKPLRAQMEIYLGGWRLAYLTALNVGDHLSAVADVAGSESPRLFAHMTLARGALEGAVRISYLLHPSGTLRDRVLRAAALLMVSASEEVRAVQDFATQMPRLHEIAAADADRRHEDVATLIDGAGIEVVRDKRRRLRGVQWQGSEDLALSSPTITSLAKQLFPNKPSAYQVFSGAVHSQPWVLDDHRPFDPIAGKFSWPFDPSALAGSVDLAVTASVSVITTFATMLGQDPYRERVEAQRREEAVSRLVLPLLGR